MIKRASGGHGKALLFLQHILHQCHSFSKLKLFQTRFCEEGKNRPHVLPV